jgi:hypothetical protein
MAEVITTGEKLMDCYERRFVRPSLLQLIDALDEAARRVK